jgi:hypothetical protein
MGTVSPRTAMARSRHDPPRPGPAGPGRRAASPTRPTARSSTRPSARRARRGAILAGAARALRPRHLVGLDRDPTRSSSPAASTDPTSTVDLVRTRFDALDEVLDDLGVEQVAGVLFDLGISSMHVDRAERGFSYRQDGPLDMRMDPDLPTRPTWSTTSTPASWPGCCALRRRAVRRPHRPRHRRGPPVTSTVELAEVVRDAIPQPGRRTGGHPATRTFQALRIAVNAELDALEAVLPAAIDRLAPAGSRGPQLPQPGGPPGQAAFADAAATGCICPPGPAGLRLRPRPPRRARRPRPSGPTRRDRRQPPRVGGPAAGRPPLPESHPMSAVTAPLKRSPVRDRTAASPPARTPRPVAATCGSSRSRGSATRCCTRCS